MSGTCDVCGATGVEVSRTYRYADWEPVMACDDVGACWARRKAGK